MFPLTMCRSNKIVLSTILWILGSICTVYAQVSFGIKAPSSVPVGMQFQVIYELKNALGESFSKPSFSDFDVLFGPALNHNDFQQITSSGSRTYRSSTFTYTLMPRREGTYTIPAASVMSEGRTYTARAMTIKVLPADKVKGGTEGGSQAIVADDLYMHLTLNRSKVYEQEGILATLKLFASTKVDIREVIGLKLPDFDGFIAQNTDIKAQREWQLERIGNKNMKSVLLQQWVLLPQRSGTLTIPSASIDLKMIVQRSASLTGDPQIDNFFNQYGANYSTIKRTLQSSPLTIEVQPLPIPRPTDFRDAVGSYSIRATSEPTIPKTGEAFKIIVTIQGSGNIKLLHNPVVTFPETFDAYDPKAESQLDITSSGASGTRTIEYVTIPREVGQHTIPPISLTYFDTESRSYKTIATAPISVDIRKGSNASLVSADGSRGDIKLIEQDIRPLKSMEEESSTRLSGSRFAFGVFYWGIYVLLFSSILFAYIWILKLRHRQADVIGLRHRNAGRVATKRLQKAACQITNGDESFYAELLQALWGYLGDKLRLSTSDLSRENILHKLSEFDVDEDLIAQVIKLIDQVDYARYAPPSDHSKPQDLYDQASLLITRLEHINTVR